MEAPRLASDSPRLHHNPIRLIGAPRPVHCGNEKLNMALIATGSNKEFKQTPEGSHMAVCFRVIDLGTQRWEYQGTPQMGRKVLLGWELHGEAEDGSPLTTDEGQPLSVSKTYTLSLGKKANLRADLESWRGKAFQESELQGFDIAQLLGQPCMITIKHTTKGDKTYSNVASVTRFPAALKNAKPKAVNKLQLFDVTEFDRAHYEALPEWIRKQIDASVERSGKPQSAAAASQSAGKAAAAAGSGFDDMDDDIPFISASPMFDMVPSKGRRMARYDY